MRYRLPCAVLVLAFAAWSQGAADQFAPSEHDRDLLYQAKKSNPVSYDVDFAVVVTAPYRTKVLKIWLPLPQSDAGQQVVEGELTSFPVKVEPNVGREPVFGNKFAYFEFDHPEGAQIIRHTFKIKVWELRWAVEPDKVAAVEKWPKTFDKYLRGEGQAVVVDERFGKLAREIVPRPEGAARDLAVVMAWVGDHLEYDHGLASLQASSENALKKHGGHCSDFHGLCAALGRALNYPTRLTYGINPLPKNSPSHCKLEAFLPPYGWVSFDVTETQKLANEIKKDGALSEKEKEELLRAAEDRLLHGFRDNTWFLQTRGSDYELVPPACKKVPVVRTIYAEADGVALSDPDSALPGKCEFAWMTVHKYTPDRPVTYPFKDYKSLRGER